MFDCWRWCSCWHWCSRAAGPRNPWGALDAEKTRDAVQSLRTALEAFGGRLIQGNYREKLGFDFLKEAIYLLELERPSANNAARAHTMIGCVADSCDKEAEGAVKAAQRAVRDVIVLRCCSVSEPRDREAFILAAEEAFGRRGEPLDDELQAHLLQAYYKLHRRA